MYRIIFQIEPVTLYSYGFMLACGFLLAAVLMMRYAGTRGVSRDDVFDCLMAILIGGLIGGRLLYVIINWQDYLHDPFRIIKLYEGGMAIHGAMIMAAFTGFITCRIKGLSFWKMADIAAPYIALGQAVGRIGCFLNGCCYGMVSSNGLGVTFPGETVMRVPSQIFSSVALIGIFVILVVVRDKTKENKNNWFSFDGAMFAMYVILYSVFRFGLDLTRGDNPAVIAGLSLSQVISVGMFLVGVLFVIARRNEQSE